MSDLIIPAARASLAGFYKFEAVRPDGRRRLLADWFPNLITNGGLEHIGNLSNWMTYCYVGTGNSAPLITDTQLQSFIAVTSAQAVGAVSVASATPPYYGGLRRVMRFGAGVAAGNLSEVGMGPNVTNTNVFSRALILDGLGSPTTVTVLVDEVLDVTYEIRAYAPTADVLGTFDVSGVTHNYTLRAARASSGNPLNGWGFGDSGSRGGPLNQIYSSGRAADATLSADVTGFLGGTYIGQAVSTTYAEYVANSLYRDATYFYGLDNGNTGGTGVGGINLACGIGEFQIVWTPAILKNNTKTLSLTFRNSWGRYTP